MIEDDPDIQAIITYILEEAGYEVTVSARGAIINDLAALNPALILMDNQLADGDGVSFCFQCKKDPATRHFPVILVSAHTDIEQMAKDSLADGFLKKPFDFEDLIITIKQFID